MKNEESSLLQALAQSLQSLEDKEKIISKLSQELTISEEKYAELKRRYDQRSRKQEKFQALLKLLQENNELHILEKMLEKQVEKEQQLSKATLKCQQLQNKNSALLLQVKRLEKLVIRLRKGEYVSQILDFTDEQIMKKEGEIGSEL